MDWKFQTLRNYMLYCQTPFWLLGKGIALLNMKNRYNKPEARKWLESLKIQRSSISIINKD